MNRKLLRRAAWPRIVATTAAIVVLMGGWLAQAHQDSGPGSLNGSNSPSNPGGSSGRSAGAPSSPGGSSDTGNPGGPSSPAGSSDMGNPGDPISPGGSSDTGNQGGPSNSGAPSSPDGSGEPISGPSRPAPSEDTGLDPFLDELRSTYQQRNWKKHFALYESKRLEEIVSGFRQQMAGPSGKVDQR